MANFIQLRENRIFRVLAAFLILVGVLEVATGDRDQAGADGTPNVTVSATGEDRVLIGDTAAFSMRACNPTGTDGYNLSWRVVLDEDDTYGGATPAPTVVLTDQPDDGETTVIWENTSDLLAGACATVVLNVSSDGDDDVATGPVGSDIDVTPEAYVNSDAFFVPDFDATTGEPVSGASSYTGNSTGDTVSTTRAAFILDKIAGNNGEGEQTRGVHGDHPKLTTLTVTNNPKRATNDFAIVDVLPPELEFLGCTDYLVDSTTDAPTNTGETEEYVGSGALQGGTPSATCIVPASVETLSTPTVLDDGSTAPIGSTRVTWDSAALGADADLAASDVVTITYLAGIPLRSNTDDWTGAKPSDASLAQGRNLDNNSGALTTETATEIGVTNRAAATGTFQGPSTTGSNPTITDTDDDTVAAEDLLIRKSSTGDVIQGEVVTNTLVIETSEYRDSASLVVTDTLPDGQCPLGDIDAGGAADAGCLPSSTNPTIDSGGGAVDAPYTSATENADGTWTLLWDSSTVAELAALDNSGTITMSFNSLVRTNYREDQGDAAPVLNGDTMTNNVDLAGDTSHRGEIVSDTTPDATAVQDISEASIDGILPTINKRVSARSGPLATGAGRTDENIGAVCAGGGITWIEGDPTPATGFGPGDYACFDLQASFPEDIDASGVRLEDLLPAGYEYIDGSATRVTDTDPDTLAATTITSSSSNSVIWSVDGDGDVSNTGHTFHWTIAAQAASPTGGVAGDIKANLQKFTTSNSAVEVFQLRDQASAEWTEAQVELVKGIESITSVGATAVAGPLDPDDDGRAVQASDVVRFRIDLGNDGNTDAINTEVWDDLPSGITCADISNISASGTCAPAGATQIQWPASTTVGAGTSASAGTGPKLTYDMTIPDDIAPSRNLQNTAAVRSYQTETNGSANFTYYPAGNIDGGVTSNTGAATDVSNVTTATPTRSKIQQSTIAETGNRANATMLSTAEQTTIGEAIRYSISVDIPEGTTVVDATFIDAIPTGMTYDGNVVLTGSNATLDALVPTTPALGATGSVAVAFPASYVNAPGTGADTLTVSFDARVMDISAPTPNPNTRGTTRTNRGVFSYEPDVGSRVTINTNSANTTIVEPNVTVSKTDDTGDGAASPSDDIVYSLSIANPTTPNNVSVAHDLVVVDTLPIGITPVNGVTPVVDGAAVTPDGGIWDEDDRTITWDATSTAAKLTSLEPAATQVLQYTVNVDDPAVASGELTNTVSVTSSSIAGAPTVDRSYNVTDDDTITLPSAQIAKSVTPSAGTVGEGFVYTVSATLPQKTRVFDATVLDALPDGSIFGSYGTASLAVGSDDACPAAAGFSGITPGAPEVDGTTEIGWFLGDLTAPSTGGCTYEFTYVARIGPDYADGSDVVGTDVLANVADLHWNQTDTLGAGTPESVPAGSSFDENAGEVTADVTVVEPLVRIDKDVDVASCDDTPGNTSDDDACATGIGESYVYTLTLTNSGDAPATDLTISDQPDSLLTNIVITPQAGLTVTDGWTSGDPDVVMTFDGPIAPDGTVTITYSADSVASSSFTDADHILNTADVPTYFAVDSTTRSANPGVTYRTYGDDDGGPGGDVAADTVDLTVGSPQLEVTKTAGDDPTDARAGEEFGWNISVENVGDAPAFNVDITDDLPAAWSYVNGSAQVSIAGAAATQIEPSCSPSCTPGAVLSWADVAPGPLAESETVTITLDAIPSLSLLAAGTTGTFDHVNSAGVGGEDQTGATANGSGSYSGPDDDASARIRRIDLSIDKSVDAGPYYYGSEHVYTVEVSNAGPDAATNINVSEVLPAGLLWVSTESASQGSYADGTGNWDVGSLPASGSATLEILVRVTQIGEITNLSEVTSADQWDVDSTPNNSETIPGEDDTDTVTITTEPSSLGDLVWFDINADGVRDSGELGIPDVTIALEAAGLDGTFGTPDDFWGPDGISGNADDITTTSVQTSATGGYAFVNLPVGDYRTTVDVSTLPVGMTQTYDDDAAGAGSLDDTSGVITLTDSDGYLDADFGYTGTGSLGDLIWEDIDGDGTLNGVEAGIDDVDVVVTWSGFDGEMNTSDDVTYSTTTAAGGAYLVGNLPAGGYNVAVIESTLPSGMVNVYDLDTGEGDNDSTSAAELADAEDRTDLDFGYQLQADLSIEKSHTGDFAVGANGEYQIVVTNSGPATAAAPITVTDDLPDGLAFVSSLSDSFACTAVSGVVTCVSEDALASGRSASLGLTVSVAEAAAPGVTNTASVSSPTFDPKPTNNSDDDKTGVLSVDLEMEKSLVGGLMAGEQATYRLKVTNLGPSVSPEGIVVVDDLPAGLAFVSATGPEWLCGNVGTKVTCRSTDELKVDSSSAIDLTVAVAPNLSGSVSNRATVTGPTVLGISLSDPSTDNNASVAGITVTPQPSPASSRLASTGVGVGMSFFGLALVCAGFMLLQRSRRGR